jgi:hypothetical protein
MMSEERRREIEELLNAIRFYWVSNPSMRFWQVIEVLKGSDDPFYLEDSATLRRAYKLWEGK